jgi:hypothetical protein
MIYPSSGPFVALRPKSKLQRAHGRSCEGGTTRSIREDIRVNRQSQHHSALQFACARWCKLSIAPILPSRLSKLRRKEPPNSLPERHQGTSPPPISQTTQTAPQGQPCAPSTVLAITSSLGISPLSSIIWSGRGPPNIHPLFLYTLNDSKNL